MPLRDLMPLTQGSLFESSPRDSSLRVGPAGWSYKDWEGIVYPSGAGRSFDALSFLADYFDTIEINSSFYSPPRPGDSASWAERVRNNPRFRFTAKAWQQLTHQDKGKEIDSLSADAETVRRSLEPLAEAGVLGALLVQFPWSFRCTPKNTHYLARILASLRDFPLAVELRHGSWDCQPFIDFLKEQGVAFCNIDQPVIGDSIRAGSYATSQLGYFRLHGRNYANWFQEDAGRDARYDYLYTREEIKALAEKIRKIKQTAQETYAITNNHFRGQSLVNAIEILAEIDADPPAVPALLASSYPERLLPIRDKSSQAAD
jgi:uncharacterized protein YecE (DUF72 family)